MKRITKTGVLALALIATVGCTKRPNESETKDLLSDKCYAPQKTVTPELKKNWVDMMIPAAQDAERIHGTPAAALIAMSGRESGYGTTLIYTNAFNAYGFKWTSSENADGRGYYTLWCQPAADPNNKYIKFKNYWDGALFVGRKLANNARYKPTTDRYVQDRRNGVPVKEAVDRWIAGIAAAGYNYDPATYKNDIIKTTNNYKAPSMTYSSDFNLYSASSAVSPRSAQ